MSAKDCDDEDQDEDCDEDRDEDNNSDNKNTTRTMTADAPRVGCESQRQRSSVVRRIDAIGARRYFRRTPQEG